MKVLVLNNMVPFLRGGAEALAEEIVRRLNVTHGIQAELVRIPFKWEPAERLIDEMLICRSLRLYATDLMIGLKFPAYLVPHHHKRIWLLHQYRQGYDLWDAGQSNIPNTPRGRIIRQAVIEAGQPPHARLRQDLRHTARRKSSITLQPFRFRDHDGARRNQFRAFCRR